MAAPIDARPAGRAHHASRAEDCGPSGAALQGYIARHYDELRRRLATYLGSDDLAGDSLHDAWLRVAGGAVPSGVLDPGPYVFRMACNLAADSMRRNWREVGLVDDEPVWTTLADGAPQPAHVAEARSELRACLRGMQELPRRRLGILLAVRLEDLSPQEVAMRYGITVRSVQGELRRARRELVVAEGGLARGGAMAAARGRRAVCMA